MAKGIGLIGNFKGKVGNTVGYKLTASNNGQTQGIRVYQPIVKNPKSAGQAEQRAKLLAVNATYRALKMVIDRGFEGIAYGNKSRLAWLKSALKSSVMPWIEKGQAVTSPVGCTLTRGTLSSLIYRVSGDDLEIEITSASSSTDVTTEGKIAELLLQSYSQLKEGDQVTIVGLYKSNDTFTSEVKSFIMDPTATTPQSFFTANTNAITHGFDDTCMGFAVIVSRMGDNSSHLRSTETLQIPKSVSSAAPYDADSKAAAIASYRASTVSNSDWAEESIK